ncbi:hypothetical protein [Coralloluteibacterium thermophilus]|uniref:Cyclase dehydrase n=1 Tax=Coralloluteibacterium thermophilum TaxID=2707049 RepID=A0ABV9NF23_9GAMM
MPALSTFKPKAPNTKALAHGLGWFSIGLGVAELAAAGWFARTLGMRGQEALIRAYGIREIATGVGILAARNPRRWVQARVAGDALDLATLGVQLGRDNDRRVNVGVAMAAVAGVAVLDLACAEALQTEQPDSSTPRRDYSDRSGFGRPVDAMRGVAASPATGDGPRPREGQGASRE